ncbi:MAG TPA: zf-HC2 domain-containing protein [Terracidiphilus sp.]|jgi:anti-sigma factor RsiW|nr:zf-HC2 domain-containing protein [Terracidiphilus sp.]
MPCDHASTLAAYLDGELPAEQDAAVQQHLGECRQCSTEVASLMRLHRGLRAASARFTPDPAFRRKLQAQIAPRRTGSGRLFLLSSAFVALAAVLVAMVWARQQTLRDESFREAADLHVSDLASPNPYDVVSSDRHTVKPWFQGKIPFSFNLPELAGTEFNLLGARLVYFDRRPAAQVVAAVRQHRISVLIVQDADGLAGDLPFANGVRVRDSFNMETWHARGLRFFVVGDADAGEVHKLAQAFRDGNG